MPRLRIAHASDPSRSPAADHAGFTLIEVLITIVVLTVGLLGTFAALRSAADTTVSNRQRQVETSLAREVIEDAGSLAYTQLTSSTLSPALQPLIAHATTTAGGGLQVNRGPSTYAVRLDVCSLDDPSDGYGSHTSAPASGGAWCSGQTSGTADSAPDDEKRLSVTVQPSAGSGQTVQQEALILNHGLPAVSCLTVAGVACPDTHQTVSYSTTTTLTFAVTTTAPVPLLQWLVDGDPPGAGLPSGASDPYAPAATPSQFTWKVPHAAGTYTISVQAQDSQGDTGPLSTIQVQVTP
jgi:prepilin-type N-terminal cleavage/methylation domain-containing protein